MNGPQAHQNAQARLEWGPTASEVSRKRAGRAAAILERLKSGPATTAELLALGGSGMSSRIRELRDEGYKIQATPMPEGHALYVLEWAP